MSFSQSIRKWLACVVVLQVLILITLSGSGPSVSRATAAGIPDAGAQLDQVIEQLKSTNEKLDKMQALLAGGEVQVTVKKSDDSVKHP